MNDALKKKHSNDSQKRYMERHTILCVTLDNEQDADIIRWLKAHGKNRKSGAVRAALRTFIHQIDIKDII